MESDAHGEQTTKATEWFDLPYEIRQMIISYMDCTTTIAFITSSPLFLIDLPRSFIKKLEFRANQFTLFPDDSCFPQCSFVLDCSYFYGACEVTCIVGYRTTWKRAECMTVNQGLAKLFNNLVRTSYALREILIYSWDFPFNLTTIRNLKRLESLNIKQEKNLDLFECGFMDERQCSLVYQNVSLTEVPLSRSQFLMLASKFITVYYNGLVSSDVNEYLKRLQEGVYSNLENMTVRCEENGIFDPVELLDGLDLVYQESGTSSWHLMADKTNLDRLIVIHVRLNEVSIEVVPKIGFKRRMPIGVTSEIKAEIYTFFTIKQK